MIISNHLKFVFIHIPKTAGDSATAALQPYLAKDDFILNNDFQAWKRRVTRRNPSKYSMLEKHSPAIVVRDSIPPPEWNSYYKFAFVRHPIQRVVSFYTYMVYKAEERQRFLPRNIWYLTPPGREGDPMLWPGMKAYMATDSFSHYIRHKEFDLEPALFPQSGFVVIQQINCSLTTSDV